MTLEQLFKQVLLLSITGSIFAVGILFIKTIFRKKLSGKIHYYIWFLLVLKLVVPMNIQSQVNVTNFIPKQQEKIHISSIIEQNFSSISDMKLGKNMVQQKPSSQNENIDSKADKKGLGFNLKTGALIWVSVTTAILLYIIFANLILSKKIKKMSYCKEKGINEILQETKKRLNVNSKISVLYNKNVKSPAVYGIIRPKILISKDIIERLTNEELGFVFLHEVSHIKRKDIMINMAIMILQSIYWFNPIIWYALYQFKQDCEIACDATAVETLNTKEVREYGQTIINMLKIFSKSNLSMGTVGFSNKYNKRRIIMISVFNKKSVKWTALALSLTLIVGCSSVTKPNNNNTNTKNSNQVSDKSNNQSVDENTNKGTSKDSNKEDTKEQQGSINDNSSSNSGDSNNSNTGGATKEDNSQSGQGSNGDNSQKALLDNIKSLAKEGKIINCDFPAKSTVIDDVEKAWGKPATSDWIAEAKGIYATYPEHNAVFGYNKGSQIFEVRSFDSTLKNISLSMIKNYFGKPQYDVKANGEEIIGYTAGNEFKILFVFAQPESGSNDPALNHYSVLYPRGTVNNMSNDPGREW